MMGTRKNVARRWIGQGVALGIFGVGLIGGAGPLAAQQPTFPGGAQSINEAFQDWQVVCNILKGTKRCAVSQQQADSRTRQRLLAVELQPKADSAQGLMFLPFGLSLEKGVLLKVGDTRMAALRFSTCLPQGCVVPLSFDAKGVALLKKGAALRIEAANDAGQPQVFSVSLKGFGPALDRAAMLILK